MSGKGSSRRPQQAPDEQVSDNWSRIFERTPIKTQYQLNERLNVALKEKADEATERRTDS